ncbi:DUF4861 domain-containing protein [Odoribacter laneus]|jgi:hypothetical protein|uniref:DUF4861 family protein n=1 Tax=Odoribacter laneus TaxID=626933 RepID=UPI0018976E38|nr:DUF4861 family protein [Odoribacter laneus]GKI21948.1 DUF4861 domain-containing protein [Odoribacter laneus]GKI26530.1 DUF4861 domain-containing protein [Odoribacter laneus]
MNKCIVGALLFCLAIGCGEKLEVRVTVRNPLSWDRQKETVEIGWAELQKKLKGVTDSTILVLNAAGEEIPSQVLFKGEKQPQSLIFQTDVPSDAEAVYRLVLGHPQAYRPEAYGRFVPERMDDYAWENNLVGHRMYGPALEATGEISNGIDVWVKKTGELLIDEWYRTGDYHKDRGKGMDCYKVGRTLGAGALAPYRDGKIVLGNNYIHQQTLDNGPIRISFRLDYAPFQVGKEEITETRTIALDANSRFNRIEERYTGIKDSLEVVAGIVVRPEPGQIWKEAEKGLMGYWEPQNNDNGDNNGHLAVGVIFLQPAKEIVEREGHLLGRVDYPVGESFVYYMGSGWSKGGVESPESWLKMLEQEREKRLHPLQVSME